MGGAVMYGGDLATIIGLFFFLSTLHLWYKG